MFNLMNTKLTVVFVDGMVNSDMVDNFILKPLIKEKELKQSDTDEALIGLIMSGAVYHCQRKLTTKLSDAYTQLLSGSALLVFDNTKKVVSFDIKGFDRRGITEPSNENVLKGSKEGFIEVLRVNTSMLRRRIPSSDLVISERKLGVRTHTNVAVVYMNGIANMEIVDEVKRRLGEINIDGIVSIGIIEAFLTGKKFSIFPKILYTERPDRICKALLAGRVAILIDGFPIGLIEPVDLFMFISAPEDYSESAFIGSLFRMLRYISAFASLVVPGFYVSITMFHHEMIPVKLANAIIQSKEGVPFLSYVEVILMLFAFEVLLEAGLRLPKSVGQAVSIVGAIVIGDAAVSAKILSPSVVIVIAAAGITGFVVPEQNMANALRVCRLLLVLCAITSGLYGVSLGLILLLYHMSTLEEYGVSYLAPLSTFNDAQNTQYLTDSLIRAPWRKIKNRPEQLYTEDQVRQR